MNNRENIKVLIMDAYCSSHVGNDALLDNSIHIIKQIFPNSEITIHAKTPDSFRYTLGINCKQILFSYPPSNILKKLQWLTVELIFMITQFINFKTFNISPHKLTFGYRKELLKDFESSDFSISINGNMINDSFRKFLPFYLFMIWLSHKCGNKVIIFPQSIGPLKRHWTKSLVSLVLNNCFCVTARDKPSIEELYSLKLKIPILNSSPDVAVIQQTMSTNDLNIFLKNNGISINSEKFWIGLTVSAWVECGVDSQHYLQSIVDALIIVSKLSNISVIIMPANMPAYGNDPSDYNTSIQVLDSISPACETVILKPEVISARLFKSITSQLDMFISTHMHASILSTMAGTPTITINTQRKLKGFMSLIGQSRYSLDITDLTVEAIIAAITDIKKRSHIIRDELKKACVKQTKDLDVYISELREQTIRHISTNTSYVSGIFSD
ncbi:MAG: polysaccharide pyruvyl transferase family protein [Candidatus Thiodiazotropha sp.]